MHFEPNHPERPVTVTYNADLGLNHGDANFLRHHRGIKRNVLRIPENELKRVWSGRQLDPCLRLAASEVEMFLVVRDRLVERKWLVYVNE